MIMEWAERANCIGTDTNGWYAPDEGSKQIPDKGELKRICERCDVIDQCLEWAIKHESHGFWAGTTPDDRMQLRRSQGLWIDDPMYWDKGRWAKVG